MVMTTPVTLRRLHRRLIHPGGHERADRLAEIARLAAPGGQFRGDRREDVAPVEGGARLCDAEARELCAVERTITARIGDAAHDRREQAVVGGEEDMPAAPDRDDARARCPTPGSTTATCTVPGGKYAKARASQKPASAGQCTTISCVRSMMRASGKRAEDAALHDADERALVAEVGGDGDDAAGLRKARSTDARRSAARAAAAGHGRAPSAQARHVSV